MYYATGWFFYYFYTWWQGDVNSHIEAVWPCEVNGSVALARRWMRELKQFLRIVFWLSTYEYMNMKPTDTLGE